MTAVDTLRVFLLLLSRSMQKVVRSITLCVIIIDTLRSVYIGWSSWWYKSRGAKQSSNFISSIHINSLLSVISMAIVFTKGKIRETSCNNTNELSIIPSTGLFYIFLLQEMELRLSASSILAYSNPSDLLPMLKRIAVRLIITKNNH